MAAGRRTLLKVIILGDSGYVDSWAVNFKMIHCQYNKEHLDGDLTDCLHDHAISDHQLKLPL
jgi:hypothetical protein